MNYNGKKDDEETIATYFEKSTEELITTIGTVAHARGINKMADDLGIKRETLYKNLSG